jgi:penicillin-binding protein 1C
MKFIPKNHPFFRRLGTKKGLRDLLVLAFAASFIISGGVVLWVANLEIPSLESFENRRVVESTKIFDKTGEVLLYDVNQDIKRTVISLDEISPYIKKATIAVEDKEFYEHNGIKPKSILRAIFANTTSLEFSQGGSTITQQVIKNALFTSEKLISRKIKEWVLAVKLEKVLSKDEILENYLNEIPYGGAIYGVEEASQTFLGKSAKDVSLAESAFLAALPQAPTYYSPYGKNFEKLVGRKNFILNEMLKSGSITNEEYTAALEEKVIFKPRETENIKAPHFVFYVIEELAERYGEDMVMNGGLRVKTTLDYELQKKGEEIAKKYALENESKFNAENAAFVAIDPRDGGIRVMVGSRDYFDENIDGNFNISTAFRQPGSTFKPFVYAEAFTKGYTPETVLFDVKTQFSTTCSVDNTTSDNGCYSPENYDNAYRGPLSMRNSLAQSVNITSVKTLYLAGIRDSIRRAELMGITTLGSPSRYGLTLVLGGGEVKLLDMVSAYSAFANEGVRNPYYAISEVRSKTGEMLDEWKSEPVEVLGRNVALEISDVLSDNVARAPAFGQSSFLHFSTRDVAVKTGTTNDYKDAWIIGYTPSITLGAWAGNNDNSPMEKKVAGFIVAPMWRAFMDEILSSTPAENFPEPSVDSSLTLKPILRGQWRGGNSILIDTVSGKRATEFTPPETTSEIVVGGVHSILYWVNKDDPRGPSPSNPNNDPQFKYWEYGVQRWATGAGINTNETVSIPTEFDNVHTPQNAPSVTVSPIKSLYGKNENIDIKVDARSTSSISSIKFFVDNQLIGEKSSSPVFVTFAPNEHNIGPGIHELKIIVQSADFNKTEKVFSFTISDL